MNSIRKVFEERENVNIGYIVAGYPSLDFTKEFLVRLSETNLDLLEIGIPYSDPLADGKLISEASFRFIIILFLLMELINLLKKVLR